MWESCRGIGGKILGIVSRKKSRPEKETFKEDKEKTERERNLWRRKQWNHSKEVHRKRELEEAAKGEPTNGVYSYAESVQLIIEHSAAIRLMPAASVIGWCIGLRWSFASGGLQMWKSQQSDNVLFAYDHFNAEYTYDSKMREIPRLWNADSECSSEYRQVADRTGKRPPVRCTANGRYTTISNAAEPSDAKQWAIFAKIYTVDHSVPVESAGIECGERDLNSVRKWIEKLSSFIIKLLSGSICLNFQRTSDWHILTAGFCSYFSP